MNETVKSLTQSDLNMVTGSLKKARALAAALLYVAQSDNLENLNNEEAGILLDDVIYEVDQAVDLLGEAEKGVRVGQGVREDRSD